jgi:tRNA A37 threonylcarbamoyladenosine dehydratase
MLDALGAVGSEKAVPTLVTTSRVKRLFGGKKLKRVKEHAIAAIVQIGGAAGAAALDDLAKSGDRALKKVVVAQRRH